MRLASGAESVLSGAAVEYLSLIAAQLAENPDERFLRLREVGVSDAVVLSTARVPQSGLAGAGINSKGGSENGVGHVRTGAFQLETHDRHLAASLPRIDGIHVSDRCLKKRMSHSQRIRIQEL